MHKASFIDLGPPTPQRTSETELISLNGDIEAPSKVFKGSNTTLLDDVEGSKEKLLPKGSAAAGATASMHAQRHALYGWLSMMLLMMQGTAFVIIIRYSRDTTAQPYLGSVCVLFTESIKLVICTIIHLYQTWSETRENQISQIKPPPILSELCTKMYRVASHSLPMSLPAGMFVMQQLLIIVAASHLDSVTFQIIIQACKLLPTALFAYYLLGQKLTSLQWTSMPILALGVIFVTLDSNAATSSPSMDSVGPWGRIIGIIACGASGLSSAYAGVYFERYLKGKYEASLWVRNIQLGMFGIPFTLGYMAIKDGGKIQQGGLMQGFGPAAWLVVTCQVLGGLLIGTVVKYCDNIKKNFALALSVIMTALVSIPVFGQWPQGTFLVGASLVLLSVFLYGKQRAGVPQWVVHSMKGEWVVVSLSFGMLVLGVLGAFMMRLGDMFS